MMNGDIGVRSEPGRGSTFWFEVTLPCAGAAPVAELPPQAVTPMLPPGAARVLLVEDNDDVTDVVCAILRRDGVEVHHVADGPGALEALAGERFDAVLMDCQLPSMDGIATTRRLRASSPEAGRVPVIALTANGTEEQRRRCLDAGMDDYLAKPFSSDQLLALLRRWVPSRSGGQT